MSYPFVSVLSRTCASSSRGHDQQLHVKIGWQNGLRATLVNRDKSLTSSFRSGRLFLTARYSLNYVHVHDEVAGNHRSKQSQRNKTLHVFPTFFLPQVIFVLNGRKRSRERTWLFRWIGSSVWKRETNTAGYLVAGWLSKSSSKDWIGYIGLSLFSVPAITIRISFYFSYLLGQWMGLIDTYFYAWLAYSRNNLYPFVRWNFNAYTPTDNVQRPTLSAPSWTVTTFSIASAMRQKSLAASGVKTNPDRPNLLKTLLVPMMAQKLSSSFFFFF